MLVPLNSTMIAVALPHLTHAFHSRLGSVGWLVTGYLIAMASRAIIAALFGVGSGLGLATVPLQVAALEAVEVSRSGFVSGMISTSRYLGSIAGISLLAGPWRRRREGSGASVRSSRPSQPPRHCRQGRRSSSPGRSDLALAETAGATR
jgi:hypothetical protein